MCIGFRPAWRVGLFVCGFEGLGIWNNPWCTCSHCKHETDWAARNLNCLEWCALFPICNWACNTRHSCLLFSWCRFHLRTTHRSVLHLLTIFSIASWCLFRISLLCSAFLKYFLFLSPPSQHLLMSGDFVLFFLHFLSFLPFLSSPPSLCCFHHFPSSPSHRYLTPRFKAEFYDVTKWVEDVNRNTQGPCLRYNLRPCPVPLTLV